MSKSKLIKKRLNHDQVRQLASKGQLFALMDSHFGPWKPMPFVRLNSKDTDPELYEMIAWNDVTYKPPFIIQVSEDDLQFIHTHFLTDRWGVLFQADSSMVELARHFQKFVIARGPDKDPYFFKFQDAAVLEVFLENWTTEQLRVFFGKAVSVGFVDLENLDFTFYDLIGDRKNLPHPEECLITLEASQLALCHKRIETDLVKIIGWHLRRRHFQLIEGLNADTLENRILYGIRKARSYSMETVADLAGFVGLLFEIAPNFDEYPKIRDVLSNREIPGHLKLDQLVQRLSEKDWREAASLYDDRSWPQAKRKAGNS